MKKWLEKIFAKKEKTNTVPKKHYILLQIEFVLLFLLFFMVVWFNYDYIVFKMLMTFNYSYTETFDKIYAEQLNVKEHGKYFKYFDKLAIKSVMDNIQINNGDEFSFLYTPDDYEETEKMLTEEKVSLNKLNENYSVIKLPSFMPENTIEFEKLIEENMSENIVIDLTDNPGGYVDEAYKIADLFLEKGTLVYYEKSRNTFYNRKFYAKSDKMRRFNNIIILQNNNTASASEILINALKDNLKNVTLIGEKTYGKGIGQFQYNLKDGYVVKATGVEFYSPKGACINKIGIQPDIKCENESIYGELEEFMDKTQYN